MIAMQKGSKSSPETRAKLKARWKLRKDSAEEALKFYREHRDKLVAYKDAVAFYERYGKRHEAEEDRRLKEIFGG
jgi:hypothetical protein